MTQISSVLNKDLERLIFQLREVGLSTKRFLKVGADKKAFEPKFQEKYYDVSDLISYSRWGVAGFEGLVLIDADSERMAVEIRAKLPATFETKSPRRDLPHFYYKVTGRPIKNITLCFPGDTKGEGEIRAQNQYLVAPGTEVQFKDLKTGEQTTGKYPIVNDIRIAEIDSEDFLTRISHLLTKDKEKFDFERIKNGVSAGERHDQSIRLATFLIGAQGLSEDTALFQLREWNKLNTPPIEDNDLIRASRNAAEYVKQSNDKRYSSIDWGCKCKTVEKHEEYTWENVATALTATIKEDDSSKIVTFAACLLAQTENNSLNIGFQSESSTGKSYIACEVASLFPENEVITLAGASPTSFFHETGMLVDKDLKPLKSQLEKIDQDIEDLDKKNDKDEIKKLRLTKSKILRISKTLIDLESKILIFLDQPHFQLLEKLRPLLSHDKKILEYKITDKTVSTGFRTKTVLIKGFPTVLFCSARMNPNDQEKTRLIFLSPTSDKIKLQESLKLIVLKQSDPEEFKKLISEDIKRQWLARIISEIRKSCIRNIIIPKSINVYETFSISHPTLLARHQRDLPRIFGLIKAHALLNFTNRKPYTNLSPVNTTISFTIIANQTDVNAGIKLYSEISRANEMGLSPYLLSFYEDIIKPNSLCGVQRSEIQRFYYELHQKYISMQTLQKEIIPALELAGLIYQEVDPVDKRRQLIYTVEITLDKEESKSDKSESA